MKDKAFDSYVFAYQNIRMVSNKADGVNEMTELQCHIKKIKVLGPMRTPN